MHALPFLPPWISSSFLATLDTPLEVFTCFLQHILDFYEISTHVVTFSKCIYTIATTFVMMTYVLFHPLGYAFLLFQDERSVQALIEACIKEEDKLYLCVSSPTIKDKPVSLSSSSSCCNVL